MSKTRQWGLVVVAAIIFGALASSPASAIPAFARKHKLLCSNCHSAMPYLNDEGRKFKEMGYRAPEQETAAADDAGQGNTRHSQWLIFDETFPVSGRLVGRFIDKAEGHDLQLRPNHELEVLSAGNFWKQGSWYFELEAEDEDGFQVVADSAFAGWHPMGHFNVVAGTGTIFSTDPYNSLRSGGGDLTVSNKAPLDVGASVNSRFRARTQFINVYGRAGKVYYAGGWSAGNANNEGDDPRDFMLRGAVDATPGITVGGFLFSGKHTITDADVDIMRYGLDFNVELGGFNADGIFMHDSVEPEDGVEDENNALCLEFFYTWMRNERPVFVPLVKYDWFEVLDGSDSRAYVTLQGGVYPIENLKLAAEVILDAKTIGDADKGKRFVASADLVF